MSDTPPGENNIESLAQRAKEVLDRVRSNTDEAALALAASVAESNISIDPDEVDPEGEHLDEADHPDEDSAPSVAAAAAAGAAVGASEVIDPDIADETVAESAKSEVPDKSVAESSESGAEEAAGAGAVVTDEAAVLDTAAVAGFSTAEPDRFEIDEDNEPDSTPETEPVATETIEADDTPVEDEDDSRRRGCLIPLLLLALLVLALLFLAFQVFDSDDDPVLVDGTTTTIDSDDDGAPANGDATDSSGDDAEQDTSTTTSSTTSTTTTTEAPALIPASTWELLGGSSNTDLFAAFGEPFGLRSVMEAADGAEFTVFAPSNEAISALSQETIGGFAADPASAEALLAYHVIDQRLSTDLLLEAAGGQLMTRVGLPIDVELDGDEFVLNGSARVSPDELEAGNGSVLVIDSVLTPPTINAVIDLGEVQFEVISAIITEAGRTELQKAVTFFRDNPDVSAVIEGHTDTDGPSEPNQRLSERRANAVRDFLVSEGIDGSRLEAVGFGESDPIVVDGVEDKSASRRIEFNIR